MNDKCHTTLKNGKAVRIKGTSSCGLSLFCCCFCCRLRCFGSVAFCSVAFCLARVALLLRILTLRILLLRVYPSASLSFCGFGQFKPLHFKLSDLLFEFHCASVYFVQSGIIARIMRCHFGLYFLFCGRKLCKLSFD